MRITIGDEDYKTLTHCLLGLQTHFFMFNYRFPSEVSQERLLCMLLLLQTICDKIFACQPSQENIAYTVKSALRNYFRRKQEALVPPAKAEAEFLQALGTSELVKKFVQDGAVENIEEHLSHQMRHNALSALRSEMPKTGKPLRQCTAAEISAQKAVLSNEECGACWAQYGPRKDAAANALKNALVGGKYIVLLPDETLKNALTDSFLYAALDTKAKRACMEIISAVFPLMNDSQKQQIEQLADGKMADYREELLALRHRCSESQFGLMDLFHVGSKAQLKQGLLDFGRALVHDKGGFFYINYDVSAVAWSELEDFSQTVDELIKMLHHDFLQHVRDEKYVLWNNDTFKILWLLAVVWFRKLFHEMQPS